MARELVTNSEMSSATYSPMLICPSNCSAWLGGSGFRVQGLGFRVQGSGFKVQGSGFRVQSSG